LELDTNPDGTGNGYGMPEERATLGRIVVK
jgi:hypothetical protein